MSNPLLRLLIGLAIAIIILLALMLVVDRGQSKVSYDCVDPTERERIRELALTGADNGFQHSMEHLFDVWVKDPNTEQPRRAQVGTTNAVNAHIRARKLIMEWSPPSCPPEKP